MIASLLAGESFDSSLSNFFVLKPLPEQAQSNLQHSPWKNETLTSLGEELREDVLENFFIDDACRAFLRNRNEFLNSIASHMAGERYGDVINVLKRGKMKGKMKMERRCQFFFWTEFDSIMSHYGISSILVLGLPCLSVIFVHKIPSSTDGYVRPWNFWRWFVVIFIFRCELWDGMLRWCPSMKEMKLLQWTANPVSLFFNIHAVKKKASSPQK